MRQILIAVSMSLCLAASAVAADITVALGVASIRPNDGPILHLEFSQPVPEALDAQVLDPASYTVELTEAPPQEGEVVAAVAATPVPGRVRRVAYDESLDGSPDRGFATLYLEGLTYGKGTLSVKAMTAGGDTIQEVEEAPWEISGPYQLAPRFDHDQSVRLQGRTVVVDFSLAYRRGWGQQEAGNPRSFSVSLEGAAPVGTPKDVDDTPGASTEASEEVADYFKLSALRSSYRKGGILQSYGLVARTTAQLKGLEAVGTWQLARLFGNNRIFAGADLEAGYRRGDAEWESLTQAAPDRGNVVARLGSVLEWGPRIGPINRDLGNGLRFFVRGRGWADWAKDEEGDGEVRFRGFLDSELFYNVSEEFRVFLRHEEGYLPPDLSERHSETFVGVGTAF